MPPFTAVLSVFYYPPDDFPGPQVRYLFAKSIAIKGIDGVRVQFWVRVATRPVYAPPGTFRTCPGGGGGYMGGFRGGGGGSFTAAPSNPLALPKFWTLCILLQVVWAWDVCCCVLVVFGWVVCSPVGFWVVAVPFWWPLGTYCRMVVFSGSLLFLILKLTVNTRPFLFFYSHADGCHEKDAGWMFPWT